MPCREAENPTFENDGSITRNFNVWDVFDSSQAEALVMSAAEPSYAGRIRAFRPSLQPNGYGVFKAGVNYSLPPQDEDQQQPNNDPIGGILEFDASGGTQHITTAKSQSHYPENAPDCKRAIGVSRDTVEGTDIIIPKLSISITKHFQIAAITGTYVKNLARLTGKTNQLDYNLAGEMFDAGELLFLGATGSSRARFDWEIVYRFEASQNNFNLDISPTITGITKKGHDYLWLMFKGETPGSGSDKRLVQVPEFAYVARVYDEADFAAILGF